MVPSYTGSIHLYRSEELSPGINQNVNSVMEVVYLELRTNNSYGLAKLNTASTPEATLRLEVELARTASDFYKIAENCGQDMNALNLILLLGKGSDLSNPL